MLYDIRWKVGARAVTFFFDLALGIAGVVLVVYSAGELL